LVGGSAIEDEQLLAFDAKPSLGDVTGADGTNSHNKAAAVQDASKRGDIQV
jgi:hypothetical protein